MLAHWRKSIFTILVLILSTQFVFSADKSGLKDLENATRGRLDARLSKETGRYDFVRAKGADVLFADDARGKPEQRAIGFLKIHGEIFGLNLEEREALGSSSKHSLKTHKVDKDQIGQAHVRMKQYHRGLPVFGGEFIVHMNDRGITAANGVFIPDIAVSTTPQINKSDAIRIALAAMKKPYPDRTFQAGKADLQIYRSGLLEGFAGQNHLAYAVEVSAAPDIREQVWIDAQSGAFLNRISLNPHALNRIVYTPEYDPNNPDLFVARREGDPPSNVPPVDNLYDFTGETYDLFFKTFGRDSYDGNGQTMRTVYLVNNVCPNAYWDSSTTNYCPGFDLDDVVAHEWGHAYTEYTHGLIYSYQSGALNESYSDIWGEIVDLLNNRDGIAGNNNSQPYPDGQRWLILEDLATGEQTVLLRDMWDPERLSNPEKITSESYHCSADDGGGVHTNSGVPNHAFVIIVDGKNFNGQTVTGIGLTKAAHIYYRAMTVYQTKTTNFAQHEQAILSSCQDLVGAPLTEVFTGAPTGELITSNDCQEVAKAMLAVEMSAVPVQCNFRPLIGDQPPQRCSGATAIFTEDWESGSLGSWSLTSTGLFPEWPNYNWEISSNLPQGKSGKAAFAPNSVAGTCGPGGDYSGQFTLDSPSITLAADGSTFQLRFDHFIESELGFDGGNLKISVNDGAFNLVPQSNYIYSAPQSRLNPFASQTPNTNPKAGEFAWHGANGGQTTGSWGTTVVNLSGLAQPGDTIRLRYDFGNDGCNGVTGWFVDNLTVDSCPELPAPALSIGSGYENPDVDGSYELTWTRPESAVGPDTLQVSANSCASLFNDDAENGFAQWDRNSSALTWQTSSGKPQHSSTAFFATLPEHTAGALTMTTKSAVTMPQTGKTTLQFSDWAVNEPDDECAVEVSEDGANWTEVYSSARAEKAADATASFSNEPLSQRFVDLSDYAGKAIKIRFRFEGGPSNFFEYTPFGWYVDNISVSNDSWVDVATTPATSHLVTGQPNGSYCYRVRTQYQFGSELAPSLFSNTVNVVVGQAPEPPAAPSQNPIQDDSTPDQTDGVDRDGKYRLTWSYPAPPVSQPCGFTIEEATARAAVLFTDDAEETMLLGSNSKWAGSANWNSAPHPDTGTLGYTVLYTDNLNATLVMNSVIQVPTGTSTILTFDSFEDIEETFDFGFVEVGPDGGAFETVATYTGVFSGNRSVDLSNYGGKSVKVRFRLQSDNIIAFPLHLGWFIDNIRISSSENFTAIGTVPASQMYFDVTGRQNGSYAYRIAGLFGNCSASPQFGPYSNVREITVELGPTTVAPSASFTANPNPAEINQTVTFDASASSDNDTAGNDPQIVEYFWSFGDGATASSSNPVITHSYVSAGTYRVTLTVTDNDGETASTEQFVVINDPAPARQEASGGGHIIANGGQANFGFEVTKSLTNLSGHLSYHDKSGKTKVQSTAISSLSVSGNRATITGQCTINKVGGFTFTVEVTDNGNPGNNDFFLIRLSNGYEASGILQGGNIEVQ